MINNIIEVSTWALFKILLRSKTSLMQYFDSGNTYNIFVSEGNVVWHYNVTKDGGADQTDFETNYKDIRYNLRQAYSAAIVGLTPPATPTDIFVLTGSATKIIKILQVIISGTRTTAAYSDVVFLTRSSADLTGTFSSPTVVPHDSNNAAGTGVVRAYTGNPGTLGTLVGRVATFKIALPVAGTITTQQPVIIWVPPAPVVLSSASEVFAVNLNSVTVAGNNFDISISWTEE